MALPSLTTFTRQTFVRSIKRIEYRRTRGTINFQKDINSTSFNPHIWTVKLAGEEVKRNLISTIHTEHFQEETQFQINRLMVGSMLTYVINLKSQHEKINFSLLIVLIDFQLKPN